MDKVKCKDCGLVDIAGESHCRRCGSELYQTRGKKGLAAKRTSFGSMSLLRIAGIVIAAYAVYAYLGQPQSDPAANPINRSQPQPTLSLRAEHEQRQTGSYKTAIQSSQGLAESQKRLEETQKLMQSEPPRPQR